MLTYLLYSSVQNLFTFIALEKCKKECNMRKIILVQGFWSLKINITQFSNGFRFKTGMISNLIYHWVSAARQEKRPFIFGGNQT